MVQSRAGIKASRSLSAHHLEELADQVAAGDRAVALFVIQRMDCEAFSACADLDPAFARGLEAAAAAGVEVMAWACDLSPTGVRILRPLSWRG